MIKNRTPYIGEIFLKFEKHPHYTGRTTLNAIHLDLGFTKLVSRMKPNITKDGHEIDPEKIKLIELSTGGIIGDYFVDGRQDPDFLLPYSFLSQDGEYLGGIRDAWEYVQNRLIICPTNPRGVAIQVKKEFFDVRKRTQQIQNYSDEFIEGFYGYSHRGGSLFKIGDRLFDPSYYPRMEDYDLEEWKAYRKKLEKTIFKEMNETGLLSQNSIRDIMPFKRRGKVIIKTWEQAEQAALNLSKYLS